RSRPPRRAEQIQVLRPGLPSALAAVRSRWCEADKLDHVAGGNRFAATVAQDQHQTAGVVERLEATGKLAVGQADPDHVAKPGSTRQPVGTDGGEVLSLVPLGKASHHLYR